MGITNRSIASDAAIERGKLAEVPAGAGTATYLEQGNLSVEGGALEGATLTGAAKGTIANTDETTLLSYSLPAKSFSAEKQTLELEGWGTYAPNGNGKTVRVHFGGQKILDSGQIAASGGTWKFHARIIRTGASTQVIYATFIQGTTIQASTQTVGTQAEGSAILLKTTGQNASALVNEVVQSAMVVTFSR